MGSGVVFDPHPSSYHDLDPKVYIEKLTCDLQDLNQPCGFLNILNPDSTKIQHDHCYNTQDDSIQPMLITHASLESVGDNYDDKQQSLSIILKEDSEVFECSKFESKRTR